MGNLVSGTEADEGAESQSTPVVVNVYDLTPLNNYTYLLGLGIFHSGVEVHGMEYGFGAHDFPTSGVFEVEPRSCPGFIYRCSVMIGTVNMPAPEFRAFMESLASEYHGDTYHLISKNCNHFTDDVCLRLTRHGLPGWVNRLAGIGAMCSCLLPESLQVTSVKQLPEYHACSEDGSECLSGNTLHDPTESDDTDHERHLLSPSAAGEVCFIKEVSRKRQSFGVEYYRDSLIFGIGRGLNLSMIIVKMVCASCKIRGECAVKIDLFCSCIIISIVFGGVP